MKLLKILEEVFNFVFFILFIAIWAIPLELWRNRKPCPYWDYPYCKQHSLVRDKTHPCKLGYAIYNCMHYKGEQK